MGAYVTVMPTCHSVGEGARDLDYSVLYEDVPPGVTVGPLWASSTVRRMTPAHELLDIAVEYADAHTRNALLRVQFPNEPRVDLDEIAARWDAALGAYIDARR